MLTRDDLIDAITALLFSAGATVKGPPAGALSSPEGDCPAGFSGTRGPAGEVSPSLSAGVDPATERYFAAAGSASANGRKRRIFLSEYDIKKMLTPPSQLLKIPKEAILSPLASDWLVLRGIKVIRG